MHPRTDTHALHTRTRATTYESNTRLIHTQPANPYSCDCTCPGLHKGLHLPGAAQGTAPARGCTRDCTCTTNLLRESENLRQIVHFVVSIQVAVENSNYMQNIFYIVTL